MSRNYEFVPDFRLTTPCVAISPKYHLERSVRYEWPARYAFRIFYVKRGFTFGMGFKSSLLSTVLFMKTKRGSVIDRFSSDTRVDV